MTCGPWAGLLSAYRRHGFTQIATRTFQVGHRGYDDVVLAKTLCDQP